MIDDFISPGSAREVPGAIEIVSSIHHRLRKARVEKTPVIYSCDWIPGSSDAGIISGLNPTARDTVVPKSSYSGFFKTDLEKFLKRWGVESLTLTGVRTETEVLYTAVDASMRGFDVDVPPDCVRGMDSRDHDFALRRIRALCPHRV
jgi:nicotinamidase-related amidase